MSQEAATRFDRAQERSQKIDALAGAVGRSTAHRDRLRQMVGEMLSSSQAEDRLGIRRQAIDERREAHKLLALQISEDSSYPAFQFDGTEVLFGLERVFTAHAEKDPWNILDILLAPDEALNDRTLLQACVRRTNKPFNTMSRRPEAMGSRERYAQGAERRRSSVSAPPTGKRNKEAAARFDRAQ